MEEKLPYCLSLVDCRKSFERKEGLIATKLLASSLVRNLPLGYIHVVRVAPKEPLFRTGREGLVEDWVAEESLNVLDAVPQWLPADFIDGSQYSWVFFLGDGSIVLKDTDHLLDTEADVLWAPLNGVPLTSECCSGYVTGEELAAERSEHPWTRPWVRGASSNVWAVRRQHYAQLITDWKQIAKKEPLRECSNKIQSAWNRLLIDSELIVTRFERGEVEFPDLGEGFDKWHEATVLNVNKFDAKLKNKFLQQQFFGTYFGDDTGLFLNIVDP